MFPPQRFSAGHRSGKDSSPEESTVLEKKIGVETHAARV
jgi:hypothetical protein